MEKQLENVQKMQWKVGWHGATGALFCTVFLETLRTLRALLGSDDEHDIRNS